MGTSRQPVEVIVRDRIYVRIAKAETKLFIELTRGFEHFNPERAMKEKIGVFCKDVPRYIKTWERADDERDPRFEFLTFPRGGMRRVREALDEAGVTWGLEDQRIYGDPVDMPEHRRSLYAHQEEALAAILERENCLLRAPTGSGKTTVILALAARAKVPMLVVVPNRVLFDQWITRVHDELGIPMSEIGKVRGKTFKLAPVTVGIQKSVAIHLTEEADRDYFGIVVADEVQLFAAKTFFACVDPFPARYRVGVSADHRRKDRKEFLIKDLFDDVVKHIKHEDLVASGHVLDVEVRVIPTDFRADWYGAVEEEDASHETPNYDRDRLLREMAADGARNRLAIVAAREMLGEGEQVLVLVWNREHGMTIEQAISGMGSTTGLMFGGDDSIAEFKRTEAGIRDGRIKCGVGTYQAVGLGFDIPRLGCAVCAGPIAGNEQLFKQVRGRVCRTSTGKSGARLVYLWDRHVYPDHLANIARWNKRTVVRSEWPALGGGPVWVPAKEWIKNNRAA